MSITVPITLVPRSGSVLGGTGVIISGPCFSGQLKCIFDNVEAEGALLNESLLLCVTPTMSHSGEVPVMVQVAGETLYYSCE